MDFTTLFAGLADPATALMSSTPVLLTVAVVQAIKAADKEDKLTRLYWLFAVAVGVLVGMFFAPTGSTFKVMLQEGLKTAAFASLVSGAKTLTGKSLPGDAKKPNGSV